MPPVTILPTSYNRAGDPAFSGGRHGHSVLRNTGLTDGQYRLPWRRPDTVKAFCDGKRRPTIFQTCQGLVEYVDVRFCDLLASRHFTIPASAFDKACLTTAAAARRFRGFSRSTRSDMLLLPIPNGAHRPVPRGQDAEYQLLVHDPFTLGHTPRPAGSPRRQEYLISTSIADTRILRRRARILHFRFSELRLARQRLSFYGVRRHQGGGTPARRPGRQR